MIAKIQNNCLLSNPSVQLFLKERFWSTEHKSSILNLNTSRFKNFDAFSEAYNATITKGRAGKMTKGRRSTARDLIYLLADRMEKLRTSDDIEDQKSYLRYLSDEYEAIPFYCNCLDLVNLAKGDIHRKTAYNHIKFLMDMEVTVNIDGETKVIKFITEKHNTSQIRVDGKRVRASNGRGDFQVWINKYFLKFNRDFPNFLTTKKSALGGHQKKNLLLQTSNISIDTKKSIYNNPQGQSGVAKPQNLIEAPLRVDGKHRNENGVTTTDKKQIVPRENVQIADNFDGSPREIIDLFPDSQLVIKKEEPKTKLEIYNEKLRQLDKVDKIVPSNSMELAVMVLAALLRRLVFPHLSPKYWKSISSNVSKMLELHILRLQDKEITNNLWEGMRYVARGIYLVHRHIKKQQEKNPDWRIKYTPTAFLRLDLEYAWFKNVIDNWLKNERERLGTKAMENTQFMAWQTAFSQAENLFARVVSSMNVKKGKIIGGYSRGMAVAGESKILLKEICVQNNLNEQTTNKIMTEFSTKIKAIRDEFVEKAETEHLEDWEQFYQHFKRA